MAKKQTNKKGNRKHGRNRIWCQAYRNSNQRNRNKKEKLTKHLRENPNDATALEALRGLQ